MKKGRNVDEENIHMQGSSKQQVAVCGLCGNILEKDEESGEYRCPLCDNEYM